MDAESCSRLKALLRDTRLAALGTLHQGFPLVSMVLCAPAADFSAFYVHISKLAYHTQDILADERVSLMLRERDDARADPSQLARLSFTGQAFQLSLGDQDYSAAQSLYLKRFPASALYFTFPDFYLFRITPQNGRFVSGLAKAFNLQAEDLRQIAAEN